MMQTVSSALYIDGFSSIMKSAIAAVLMIMGFNVIFHMLSGMHIFSSRVEEVIISK